MRPKNWDRLLYNLSFSNAVILYTDLQEPLIRYLSDIQDEYRLSYIPSLKDQTDKLLLSTVLKQLTDATLVANDKPLKYLLDEQDHNDNCYTVAIKGLPSDPVINQLLDCMQYFAGRFNVVFEVTSVQASLFSQNYPSQIVSLIGPSSDEKAHLAPFKNTTKANQAAHKSTKASYLIWLSLAGLCLLFTLGIWWFLSQDDIPSSLSAETDSSLSENINQTTPEQPSIDKLDSNQPNTLVEPETDKAELDLVEQAVLHKDMTAAEYFASKKKNQQAEAADNPDNKKSSDSSNNQNNPVSPDNKDSSVNTPEPLKQQDSVADTNDKATIAETESQTAQKPTSAAAKPQTANKPAIAQQNKQQTEPSSGNYDNLWYQQQNPKQYVIQLTLVSSETVLDEFLASPDIQTLAESDKLKVYASDQRFGVTYGIYQTHQAALIKINSLPGSIKNAGAFAKSVSAIAQLIAKKK